MRYIWRNGPEIKDICAPAEVMSQETEEAIEEKNASVGRAGLLCYFGLNEKPD